MTKTVSLEIAKKLKEAGFPQDTELGWINPSVHWRSGEHSLEPFRGRSSVSRCYVKDFGYAAPDVSELLGALPDNIEIRRGSWWARAIARYNDGSSVEVEKADTLPDALALLWLELNGKEE